MRLQQQQELLLQRSMGKGHENRPRPPLEPEQSEPMDEVEPPKIELPQEVLTTAAQSNQQMLNDRVQMGMNELKKVDKIFLPALGRKKRKNKDLLQVNNQLGGKLLLKNDLELMASNPATTFLQADNADRFTTSENIYHHKDDMNDLLRTYKQFMRLSLNKTDKLRRSIYLQNLNKRLVARQQPGPHKGSPSRTKTSLGKGLSPTTQPSEPQQYDLRPSRKSGMQLFDNPSKT